MKSPNFKYLVGVDHLRAYAAILVLLYHSSTYIFYKLAYDNPFGAGNPPILTQNPLKALALEGHYGVALFMVLSGFIFTVGLYGKNIKYWGFIKNRLIRIYPLYIFILLAAMSAYPIMANFNNLALAILPLVNLPQAFHTNLPGAAIDPFGMSWTIAVEFQFYLLFPFLLALLNKKMLKQIFFLWGAIILMRALLVQLPGTDDFFISYSSILGRFDQFFAGILAGLIFIKYKKYYKNYLPIILICSLLLLLPISLKINHAGGIMQVRDMWSVFLPAVLGIVSAGIVISYVTLVQSFKKRGYITNLIAKIGELSYSIYLTHILVIIVIVAKFPGVIDNFGNTWIGAFFASIFIVLPVTLATSFITYHGIEKPFLDLRKKYTK